MLDALVNFAVVNLAFMIVAGVVLLYAIVRITTRVKATSAQLDAHSQEQLAAIDRDRASAPPTPNMHISV